MGARRRWVFIALVPVVAAGAIAAWRLTRKVPESIVVQTLARLAAAGVVDGGSPLAAIEKYALLDVNAADPGSGLGDS